MFDKFDIRSSTSVTNITQKTIKPLEASKVYAEMLEQFKKDILDLGTFEFLGVTGCWLAYLDPMTERIMLSAKIKVNNDTVEFDEAFSDWDLRYTHGERIREIAHTIRDEISKRISNLVTIEGMNVLAKYVRQNTY